MKRNEIIFFISFAYLENYYVAYKYLISRISKNFQNIYFVNCENLKLFFRNKKFEKKILLKFPKKIKFVNPKNFKDFEFFLKKKNPLIINDFGRGFEYYRLLFFIKTKRIPQILAGHVGNIQASTFFWHKININIIKLFLFRNLPRLISRILVFFKVFSPVDVRFVSNKKYYANYIKNSKKKFPFRLPTYYKEIVLVKGKSFDNFEKEKQNLSEKYILLLDMQPEYDDMKFIKILEESTIKKHYENLNNLLSILSKKFKKKVIISIHPSYDLKKTSERFKNYQVKRLKTQEYIKKSFIVLFFDSSAILPAITLKKKIICLRSDLYKGKKYNSDLYKDILHLKAIEISKKITIKKSNFIKDLNKRINFYDGYLKNYTSSNLPETGSEKIVKFIKSRYF